MRQHTPVVVVVGTGGTIAGEAAHAGDPLGYTAATLGIEALLDRLPKRPEARLEAEQLMQRDSKDMSAEDWQALALRLGEHLARPEVGALVVTHGTDTLEETAWFLQRVLEPRLPVVLVAAMRPATSLQADGPQNLADALTVALDAAARGRRGVMAVMAGRVWEARGLRKGHTFRLDALQGGEAGALGAVEAGSVRWWRESTDTPGLPDVQRQRALSAPPGAWPRVAVVSSHAGSDGSEVAALLTAGFQGLVVAGTGHATVHHRLQAALDQALLAGSPPPAVWIGSRCPAGDPAATIRGLPVQEGSTEVPALTVWQARVELQLRLLG